MRAPRNRVGPEVAPAVLDEDVGALGLNCGLKLGGFSRTHFVDHLKHSPRFIVRYRFRVSGALVVFEVSDISEVERFNAADPYVLNGVYDRIELLRWDKTIG